MLHRNLDAPTRPALDELVAARTRHDVPNDCETESETVPIFLREARPEPSRSQLVGRAAPADLDLDLDDNIPSSQPRRVV